MPRPARYKKPPAPVIAPREFVAFHFKLRAFINAYLKNGRSGRLAAITAGYSPTNAAATATRMLKLPEVKQAIKAHDDEQSAVVGLSVNRTLREVARIAYADPIKLFDENGALKHVKDMDPDMRAAIQTLEVETRNGRTIGKVKLHSKTIALDQAMRHLGQFNKDNEQRHDVVQMLIVDANRTIDAKFSRLIEGRAVKTEAEPDS